MNMSQNQLRRALFGERNLNFSSFAAPNLPSPSPLAISFTPPPVNLWPTPVSTPAPVPVAIAANPSTPSTQITSGPVPVGVDVGAPVTQVPVTTIQLDPNTGQPLVSTPATTIAAPNGPTTISLANLKNLLQQNGWNTSVVGLNSFAAFADTLSDLNPDTTTSLDNITLTPADTTPVSVSAATAGSTFSDVLAGIVTAFTPAASAAVKQAIAPADQASAMALYLQGKLPGYQLNSAGQLVPITAASSLSSYLPLILLAGGGVLLFMMMRNKS